MRAWQTWVIGAAFAGVVTPVTAQPRGSPDDLAGILTRIGARIEQYFARAQSIICDERVLVQPLGYSFSENGRARDLRYELRIAWDAAAQTDQPPDATVLRQIQKINGRSARANEDPGCLDPQPVSPEPLSILLPGRHDRYTFSAAGLGREADRPAVMLDYKPRDSGGEEITWLDDCVSVSLPGRTTGRVWADADTGDVLRLDERLRGLFEFPVPKEHRLPYGPSSMTIERADSSIRYRSFTFRDPDETVILPHSIETFSMWRGASTPRVVTTQRLSNCRRFLTDGRVVQPN